MLKAIIGNNWNLFIENQFYYRHYYDIFNIIIMRPYEKLIILYGNFSIIIVVVCCSCIWLLMAMDMALNISLFSAL